MAEKKLQDYLGKRQGRMLSGMEQFQIFAVDSLNRSAWRDAWSFIWLLTLYEAITSLIGGKDMLFSQLLTLFACWYVGSLVALFVMRAFGRKFKADGTY